MSHPISNRTFRGSHSHAAAAADETVLSTTASSGRSAIDRHQQCEVCGKVAYRGTEMFVPLPEDMQIEPRTPQTNLELEEFVHGLNSPRGDDPIRIDAAAAQRTTDRCLRRVRRLRRDFVQAGLLDHPQQRFTGPRSHARVMAPLHKHEVVVGGLLGTGGFSSVYEIAAFQLEDDHNINTTDPTTPSSPPPLNEYAQRARHDLQEHVHRPMILSDEMDPRHRKAMQGATVTSYSVKHLRRGLTKDPERFERAALDLVLEVQLLLVMDHPHIVAMRGWSYEGVQGLLSGKHTGFFFVMDRLSETLEDRIFMWRDFLKKYRGKLKLPWAGKQKFYTKLDDLLGQRLEVAHDIASALEYMHSLRIINRDLKSSNIGFDGYGVLKLFDFGLSRLMPARKDYMADCYKMSRVGTKFYMAPEVRKKLPYNESVDVYSYGVVAWEVLSLGSPREILRKYRSDSSSSSDSPRNSRCPLPTCECWPMDVSNTFKACLMNSPERRPPIGSVRFVLEGAMTHMKYQRRINLETMERRPSLRMDLSDYVEDGAVVAADEVSFATSRDGASTVDDHDWIGGATAADNFSESKFSNEDSKQPTEDTRGLTMDATDSVSVDLPPQPPVSNVGASASPQASNEGPAAMDDP